jgi:fido (protein-threonine AMPylation protein)
MAGRHFQENDLGSFSGPKDDPESPFYRAEGMTPDETWDAIREGMVQFIASLDDQLAGRPVSTSLLVEAHKHLFGELFPADAGRFRGRCGDPSDYGGGWEDGPFGIAESGDPAAKVRSFRGTHPPKIKEKLDVEFARFDKDASEIAAEAAAANAPALRDSTLIAGRLYARILRIHPFVDGNLRAAFVVLGASLRQLDLEVIEFGDQQEEHDRALLAAFEGKNEPYEPMAALIERQIRGQTRQNS